MDESDFKSIYDYIKIIDFIHYKDLYKQSKRIGLELTQNIVYSTLKVEPYGFTLKHVHKTYKYLCKKYKEAKEKFYHTQIGQ